MTAREEIVERIGREGPIAFDAFVELALYGDGGFFTRARGAGRAGRDFVTSPEVGRLFGALVARALDGWWRDAGEPDPFLVIEAGAGRGRLAADVLAAATRVRDRAALRAGRALAGAARGAARPARASSRSRTRSVRWCRDDDDAPRAGRRHGPDRHRARRAPRGARSTASCSPTSCSTTCRSGSSSDATARWSEVRVAVDGDDARRERSCPATSELAAEADLVRGRRARRRAACRCPPRSRAGCARARWRCGAVVLVIVDYAATGAELVERGEAGWLRTYREHERGVAPLVAPGEQDITIDVPAEYLVHAAARAGFHARARRDAGRVAARARRSTTSSTTRAASGTPAPTSATSRPCATAAGSARPRAVDPAASAPTASSSSPADPRVAACAANLPRGLRTEA